MAGEKHFSKHGTDGAMHQINVQGEPASVVKAPAEARGAKRPAKVAAPPTAPEEAPAEPPAASQEP